MTHRVLLVANRTLASEDVATAVRERVAAGATELWVVAPVTARRGQASVSLAGAAPTGEILPMRNVRPDAEAYELAEQRLREALDRFRGLGITVGGEVGDEDPFKAVSKAMGRAEFAEVVVSTLPKAVSQWLRVDLPSRVHRKFKVPVTTVATSGD